MRQEATKEFQPWLTLLKDHSVMSMLTKNRGGSRDTTINYCNTPNEREWWKTTRMLVMRGVRMVRIWIYCERKTEKMYHRKKGVIINEGRKDKEVSFQEREILGTWFWTGQDWDVFSTSNGQSRPGLGLKMNIWKSSACWSDFKDMRLDEIRVFL